MGWSEIENRQSYVEALSGTKVSQKKKQKQISSLYVLLRQSADKAIERFPSNQTTLPLKDLGSLQHRGDEALPFRVAGANSNLKHSMMY